MTSAELFSSHSRTLAFLTLPWRNQVAGPSINTRPMPARSARKKKSSTTTGSAPVLRWLAGACHSDGAKGERTSAKISAAVSFLDCRVPHVLRKCFRGSEEFPRRQAVSGQNHETAASIESCDDP